MEQALSEFAGCADGEGLVLDEEVRRGCVDEDEGLIDLSEWGIWGCMSLPNDGKTDILDSDV